MIDVPNCIFNLSILIGFVLPLLNLLTGWFGSFLGVGMDVDAGVDVPSDFSVDINTDISVDINADISMEVGADANAQSGGSFPFNIMCFCLFLVVFGAFGHMAKRFMDGLLLTILLLAGCLVMAGLFYWLLYTLLVKRLKNSDSTALSYQSLRGKRAEVTLVIMADTVGTISLPDSTGAPISFRAKMDPDLKSQLPDAIPKGESVIITEFDSVNKLCHVSLPYNKFSQ